jgi:hypothetical protein
MTRKTKRQSPDRWKGYTYEKKQELLSRVNDIRKLLPVLQNDITHSSTNIDVVYNEIFEVVESLYGELDIGNLTQDKNRRWKKEKERVRKSQ